MRREDMPKLKVYFRLKSQHVLGSVIPRPRDEDAIPPSDGLV